MHSPTIFQRHAIVFAAGLLLIACPETPSPKDMTSPTPDVIEDTSQDVSRDMGDVSTEEEEMGPPPYVYPAPDAWGPRHGPGAPAITFTQDQLYQNCAFLDGGPEDKDHHNLMVMFDGYVMMPWALDAGTGGISFFDLSDPCNPKQVGRAVERTLRETHTIGFTQRGDTWWAITVSIERLIKGGLQFWNVTDATDPKREVNFALPGFVVPDAYKRVYLSTFWAGRYIYAGGSENGVAIVDAADPTNPELLKMYTFEPIMQVGQVQAIGNLLVVTASKGSRTVLLDISDPADPQPIPNGDFDLKDEEGEVQKAYFTNTTGGYLYYARKSAGSGMIVYDIQDPTNPTFRASVRNEGGGGYVFIKENHAFVGESNFAAMYDISDLDNITSVARFDLKGDLDTITPIGNVAVLSVDGKGNKGEASAVVPTFEQPDTRPPEPTWVYPPDGAKDLARTTRVGVTFSEFIEPRSVFEGSVRLYREGMDPNEGHVEGYLSTQETIVTFDPKEPLESGVTYVLEFPAGGVVDLNGNALAQDYKMTFTTADF